MPSTHPGNHVPTSQEWTTTMPSELETPNKSNPYDSQMKDYLRACQSWMVKVEESEFRLGRILEPGKDSRHVKNVTTTWSNHKRTPPTGHMNLSQELPNIGKRPDEHLMLGKGPLPPIKDLIQSPQQSL